MTRGEGRDAAHPPSDLAFHNSIRVQSMRISHRAGCPVRLPPQNCNN